MQFSSTCPRAYISIHLSAWISIYCKSISNNQNSPKAILWYFLWKLLWNWISIRNKRKLNNFQTKKGQLIFYYNILFSIAFFFFSLLSMLVSTFLPAYLPTCLPLQSFAYLYFICSVVDRQHICRSTCSNQSQYIIHCENRRAQPIPSRIHHYNSRECVVGRKPIPTIYKAPLNQSVYEAFQSLFS